MGRRGVVIDLSGQKFGKLTVLERANPNQKGGARWLCQCECGQTTTVDSYSLRSGHTKSCGCIHGEFHGSSYSRLYGVWNNMRNRCYNPNKESYKHYGGRGIRVCDEWLHSFAAFKEWAMSTGYDPSAPYGQCTLDRIDVNGNYEPSNCRWVDFKTQANNTRAKTDRRAI